MVLQKDFFVERDQRRNNASPINTSINATGTTSATTKYKPKDKQKTTTTATTT
jgi:hypothetical protein